MHCLGPQLLFEKVNFNGRNQIGRPAHTLTQRLDDLPGFPPVESHLTCIVKTNSPCLVMKMYIFQFQQATNFTASLLFQPQLITTMYMQLHIVQDVQDGAAYGCCGVERSRSFNVFVCLFCV